MTNEALQKKINLVMDKLIHLGGADYENDKNISLKDAIASGNVARDFGIEEWGCTVFRCCRTTTGMTALWSFS